MGPQREVNMDTPTCTVLYKAGEVYRRKPLSLPGG
jgi:hypothetical protein